MTHIAGAVALFRTQWPTRYTDACVIKRKTGMALNQTTGVNEPTYTTNYTGPCLIRPASARQVEAGQEQVATHSYDVSVPYTEIDHLPEDLVDITASTDAFLVGKQFVVVDMPGDTYITNRMIPCEEVVSG